MTPAQVSRGPKLLPSDLAAPRPKRRFRVAVIGASMGGHGVQEQLLAWGAGDAVTLDGLHPIEVRGRLAALPVDAVLIVGPLWTSALLSTPPTRTPVGLEAARYLAGGFPVRWLRGDVCSPLTAMPAPGDA